MIDERKEREEGEMWEHGESEGGRTQGGGNKVSVDGHETGTGAD